MKKRILALCMVSALIISQMISCESVVTTNEMYLKPTTKIEKNKDLLQLVEKGKSYKAYDYKVNENVKWIYFKGYALNDKNNWEEASLGGFTVNELKGNLVVMTIGDNNTIKISYRDKDEVRSWIGNEGDVTEIKSAVIAVDFVEKETPVELNKEIPIALQVVNDDGKIESFAIEDFYNVEKFKDYKSVTGATVTFSDKELSGGE